MISIPMTDDDICLSVVMDQKCIHMMNSFCL